MRQWLIRLNACPLLEQTPIRYGGLGPAAPSMALIGVGRTAALRRYINGGCRGELNARLLYRMESAGSPEASLLADELLEAIAQWAAENPPALGGNFRVLRIRPQTRATVLKRRDGGEEDHQILLNLIYEEI